MATRSTNFSIYGQNSSMSEFQIKSLFSTQGQVNYTQLQYGLLNGGFQQCYGCPKNTTTQNNNIKK
jgi:hypothetical protein